MDFVKDKQRCITSCSAAFRVQHSECYLLCEVPHFIGTPLEDRCSLCSPQHSTNKQSVLSLPAVSQEGFATLKEQLQKLKHFVTKEKSLLEFIAEV